MSSNGKGKGKGKGTTRRGGAASTQERKGFLERMEESGQLKKHWRGMETNCPKSLKYDEMIASTTKEINTITDWLKSYNQTKKTIIEKQQKVRRELYQEFERELRKRLDKVGLLDKAGEVMKNIELAEKELKEDNRKLRRLEELHQQAMEVCEKSTVLFNEEGKKLFEQSKEVLNADRQALAITTNIDQIDISKLSSEDLIKDIKEIAVSGFAKVSGATHTFKNLVDRQKVENLSEEFKSAHPEMIPYLKVLSERNKRISEHMDSIFSEDKKNGILKVKYTQLVGESTLFDRDWTEDWKYLKGDYPYILQEVNPEAFGQLVEWNETPLLDQLIAFLKGVRMIAYANDLFEANPLAILQGPMKDEKNLRKILLRTTLDPLWYSPPFEE